MTWLFCKNFGSIVPYLDCISVFDGIVILQNVPKHCSIFRLYLNICWHGYFAKISEALFHIWIVSQYLMAWFICKKFRCTAPYLDCISILDGMVTLQKVQKHCCLDGISIFDGMVILSKVPKHCFIFGLYLNIWWHGYFTKSSEALIHIWIVYVKIFSFVCSVFIIQ